MNDGLIYKIYKNGIETVFIYFIRYQCILINIMFCKKDAVGLVRN